MIYIGSKRSIAKHILPIILNDYEGVYIEPFVGGGNMIENVTQGKRIGYDCHHYLIQALRLIRDNPQSLPRNNKEFTEADYKRMKDQVLNNELPGYQDAYAGVAGFTYSFGGRWFDSWARNKYGSDYVAASYRNAQKQSPKLKGILFNRANYWDIEIPKGATVYCDKPYEGTSKYKGTGNFNHAKFWEWARQLTLRGAKVFVSEYSAPEDWTQVWQKEIITSLSDSRATRREKLFIYGG